MVSSKLWKKALLLACGGATLFAGSCTTSVRDAVQAGGLDFVTGAIAATLTQILAPWLA